MKTFYTKAELEKLEDRYENEFALSFETEDIPDQLIEMCDIPYSEILRSLWKENFSLIICIPHLPVVPALKSAKVLQRNDSFKLLEVSAENWTSEIEGFLKEREYDLTFFLIQNSSASVCELPRTSQERIKISNLANNQIYRFSIEIEECTAIKWK